MAMLCLFGKNVQARLKAQVLAKKLNRLLAIPTLEGLKFMAVFSLNTSPSIIKSRFNIIVVRSDSIGHLQIF